MSVATKAARRKEKQAAAPVNHEKDLTDALQWIVTRTGHRADRIYEDFLYLTEYTLRRLPMHLASALTERKLAEDDEEGKTLWARIKATYKHDEVFNYFRDAFHALLNFGDDYMNGVKPNNAVDGITYGPDLVGHLYETWGWPNRDRGQYWTPWDVCLLMAQMTLATGNDLNRRILDTINKLRAEGGPVGIYLDCFGLLTGAMSPESDEWAWRNFVTRILPLIKPHMEPIHFMEPCCGSGRLCLAFGFQFPQWAFAAELVQIFAADIDPICVLMTKINMLLYGMGNTGIYNMMLLVESELAKFSPAAVEVVAVAKEHGIDAPETQAVIEQLRTEKLVQAGFDF